MFCTNMTENSNSTSHRIEGANLRIRGVIPARFASTRFPGKPLADLFGKPMIYWVARQVSQCKGLDSWTVATDSPQIAEVCAKFAIPVEMTSENHVNGTERIAELAAQESADVYINIQGDEPMISPAAIDKLARFFRDTPSAQYVQTGAVIQGEDEFYDDTVVKMVLNNQGRISYLSRAPIPFFRQKTANSAIPPIKCLGLYGFSREMILRFAQLGESPLEHTEGIEQLRIIDQGECIDYLQIDEISVSVDTPEDLTRIHQEHGAFFLKDQGVACS